MANTTFLPHCVYNVKTAWIKHCNDNIVNTIYKPNGWNMLNTMFLQYCFYHIKTIWLNHWKYCMVKTIYLPYIIHIVITILFSPYISHMVSTWIFTYGKSMDYTILKICGIHMVYVYTILLQCCIRHIE